MSELRFALRALRRAPALTAGVIATFALSIGMTAGMYDLVRRLMFAPPPGVQEAESLMRVNVRVAPDGENAVTMSTVSYPFFRGVAKARDVVESAAGVRVDTTTTGVGESLAQVAVAQVTGDYFRTLGVGAALGRVLGPADDEMPSGSDVVVLSHAYWRRVYALDPQVIGTSLIVNGQTLTIIGVAARGFQGVDLGAVELFVPLSTAMRTNDPSWQVSTGMRLLAVIARLRPGVTPTVAAERLLASVRESDDGSDALAGIPLTSLASGPVARDSRQGTVALLAAAVAAAVLLIATANVGTLLLLRALRRRREIAVRLALGVRPLSLLRQSLLESLVLSTTGALAGVVVATWFADSVRVLLMPEMAAGDRMLNSSVVVASVIVALIVGVLAGLAPLAQWRHRNLSLDIRTGTQASGTRLVLHRLLLRLQVAMCAVLLVGCGAFVMSIRRVQAQDLGFPTARLLFVTLDFRGSLSARERDAAHVEAARRVLAIPGVKGATIAQGIPFGPHNIPPIHVPGYVLPSPQVQQLPILYGATPAYLAMMDVTLLQGRLFTEADGATAPRVVLVNETMARTMWPGVSPIGRCVQAGFPEGPFPDDPMAAAASLPCREVVGVVRDSRARSLRTEGGEATLMQYYIPFPQLPPHPSPDATMVSSLLVEATGDPARVAPDVQRLIQGTSAVPVYARVQPYQELLDPQLRSWRLGASLLSLFGAVALVIAATGVFAVVSYLTAQRRPELGVRLAVGGSPTDVRRAVMGDALRLGSVGLLVGLLISLSLAPLVQPMLFETSARSPLLLLGSTAVLLVMLVIAAAVPAHRAGKIDPLVALRSDG